MKNKKTIFGKEKVKPQIEFGEKAGNKIRSEKNCFILILNDKSHKMFYKSQNKLNFTKITTQIYKEFPISQNFGVLYV